MDSIALLQGSQQKWHLSFPGVEKARKTVVGSGGDGRAAKLGLVLESRELTPSGLLFLSLFN